MKCMSCGGRFDEFVSQEKVLFFCDDRCFKKYFKNIISNHK
jgi:hypothetical protein